MESDTGSVRSRASTFSEATKIRAIDLNGEECWACGSEGVDICHVVAREDRQVSILLQGRAVAASFRAPI